MNVLMMTHVMYPMGTWYRALNLAYALGRRGHSVSIVRGGMQRLVPLSEQAPGVTIWAFPRLWGSSLFHLGTRMPWDLAARVALQVPRRFDVVHGFTHHLNALFPALAGRWVNPAALIVGDRDDLWTQGGLYGDGASSLLQRATFSPVEPLLADRAA